MRGRLALAQAGMPRTIAPWLAACDATMWCSFALRPDRRVEIRCQAFALEGNR
jgi:hypothetical protein